MVLGEKTDDVDVDRAKLEIRKTVCLSIESEGLRWQIDSNENAVEWIQDKSLNGISAMQRMALRQAVEGGCAAFDGAGIYIRNHEWYLLDEEERQCLVNWPAYIGAMHVKAKGILNQDSFRYEVSWIDENRKILVGAQSVGCSLSYGTRKFLLNQFQCEALNVIAEQNVGNESVEANNLRRFAHLKKIAPKANLFFDRYLQKEEAILVDRIGVVIQEADSGEVMVEPLVEGERDDEFNHSFKVHSKVVQRYDLPQADGGRKRIVLSSKAEEGLLQIKEVALWPEKERKNLLEAPMAPFDPEIISFEDIKLERYSERVAGIVEYESIGMTDPNQFKVEWVPENFNMTLEQDESNGIEQLESIDDKGFQEELMDIVENADSDSLLTEKHILQVRDIDGWHEDEVQLKCCERPQKLRDSICVLDHQKYGVVWLNGRYDSSASSRGALLADDMGLGKTLQVLVFLLLRRERMECEGIKSKPDLIVAPVVLLDNWLDEMEKFFSQLPNCLTLHGNVIHSLRRPGLGYGQEYRGKPRVTLDIEPIQSAEVVLTTYETVRDYQYSLGQIEWATIVADEAQRVKNPMALSSLALRAMKADFRIACTATPIENSLMDLWSISDFAVPGLLGVQQEFKAAYCNAERSNMQALRQLIRPTVLRRMKQEILKDLPEKVERKVEIPLSSTQWERYIDVIRSVGNGARQPGSMLKILHRLRDICSCLLDDEEELSNDKILSQNSKLIQLMNIVDSIASAGEKVIVFTDRKAWQRVIAKLIEEKYSVPVAIINGDVPGVTRSKGISRKMLIDLFRSRQGFGALVLSPVAAGYGITVTEANHVIHFSRLWNPAKEDQATDRAYRIGQEKTVQVYYLISTAPQRKIVTFDERLDELLTKKRQLAGDVLVPSQLLEVHASDFASLFEDIEK